jgi:RHS repeat-associated protein
MTGHPRITGAHAMFTSFSAGRVSMAAIVRSIESVLRRLTVGCRGVVAWAGLLLALLGFGATSASAQEVVEYYATDVVGSIRVVFDPSGNVKARSDYLPFGEEWQPATPGGPLPSQRFTGQQRDTEEGHDNFNARSYQVRTGRFSAVDPVFVGAVANPQGWNRYRYAANNPLKFTDPTGMFETCEMTVDGSYSCYYPVGGGGGGGGGSWGWINPWYGAPGGNPWDACGAPICAYEGGGGGGGETYNPDDGDDSGDSDEGDGQIIIVNPSGSTDAGQIFDLVDPFTPPGPAAAATITLKIVSKAFRALFAGTKLIDPATIRFSQNSIKASFDDYGPVDNLIGGLRSGAIDPFSIPPIRLAENGGLLFTLDNRRLYAFQEAGVQVPYIWAREYEIIDAFRRGKVSTVNNGTSIRVRGR